MNGYDEESWEIAWWTHRADICTCGAWRTPYRWCDDGCPFITPQPHTYCKCDHPIEAHDVDDGCGACAMAMTGPCRRFRPKNVAPSDEPIGRINTYRNASGLWVEDEV